MGTKMIERATGQEYDIPPEEVSAAVASGLYEPISGAVEVYDPELGVVSVDAGDVASHSKSYGSRALDRSEFIDREDQARKEREHDTLGGEVLTLIESGVDSATLGGYGAMARLIGSDEYNKNRRERAEVNDTLALTGNIGGAVIPGLLSGGTGTLGRLSRLTPAGKAAQLGEGMVRSGQMVRGMAVEGALFGAGQGLQDTMLSEDPVTLERVVGSVGSGALYGGALGGATGVFAKAMGKGLKKAKAIADDMASKAPVADDLSKLDKAGLRDARLAETRALGEQVVDGAKLYRQSADETNAFLVATGSDKKILAQSKAQIRRALDDAKGLAERPSGLLKPLRREEQALEAILAKQDDILATLAREDDAILQQIAKADDRILKGTAARKYADWSGKALSKKAAAEGIELAADQLDDFAAALRDGQVRGARSKALGSIEGLLEQNRRMQSDVLGILDGTAPKLRAIDDARDALSTGGRKKGLVENAIQGSVFGAVAGALPFGGPVSMLAAGKVSDLLTDLVFNRMGKTAAESAKRSSAAIDAFLEVGKRTRVAAPPLSSKILSSAAFGPSPVMHAEKLAQATKGKKPTLLATYQEREREIRDQTTLGPSGQIVMRPEARQAVAQRLSGVRVIAPKVADKLETMAARRIEFLASKLPKKPDYVARQVGPERWKPSEMEMRAFARYMSAVEDPGGVEERLAEGTVTPEDAEAYRTVYPERFRAFQMELAERLPELRESLPYARRLSLSIFSGVPVDPAMEPQMVALLQGQFAAEPGTEGGFQAPTAQPQFGSVSRPEPTQAQERAG